MTYVQIAESDAEQAEPGASCSWSCIAAGVRLRALELQAEAANLLEWAAFLDGLGELERSD